MIVCVCHRVSDREIIRHALAGMNFKAIQRELGVARQCGRCAPCARELVAQCHAERQDKQHTASAHFSGNSTWTSSSHLLAA